MQLMKYLRPAVLFVSCFSAIAPYAADQGVLLASSRQAQSPVTEVRRISAEEVQAFLRRDSKTMARLWSDDFVVTNPLNQFVTKQQVLGMVESGVLVIT